MRRFDKKKQMVKANILAEQRYLKSKGLIKEDDFDSFERRPAYIDSNGNLVGHRSDNQMAAAKLAYNELKEAGVPVKENRWHNNDPTVLFIIDTEEEGSEKWVNPFYGSDIAKMEKWKNPKISNFVSETLNKYQLYGEFADGATIEIRSFSRS